MKPNRRYAASTAFIAASNHLNIRLQVDQIMRGYSSCLCALKPFLPEGDRAQPRARARLGTELPSIQDFAQSSERAPPLRNDQLEEGQHDEYPRTDAAPRTKQLRTDKDKSGNTSAW